MRMIGIVAVLALLAGPAWAQAAFPKYGEPDKAKSQADIAGEKEAERAYKRSLGNIPEQKTTDPWGAVRSDNAAPKAAAKPPAAAAKPPAAAAKPPAKPKAAKTDAKTDSKTDSKTDTKSEATAKQ
jgi:Tfp pilus assembly protein PilE